MDRLLAPISTEHPCGENLRYDPFYTKLKNARIDEDPRLSQGVWKRDVIRADWPHVIDLCENALIEKTKDLQIIAWLCDAYAAHEHITGISKAIKLLEGVLKEYAPSLYPEDEEHKEIILDWLDDALYERLLQTPITSPRDDYKACTMHQWIMAQNLTQNLKKDAQLEATLINLEKKGDVTERIFLMSIKNTDRSFYEAIIQDVDEALEALDAFHKSYTSLELPWLFPLFHVKKELPNLKPLLNDFQKKSSYIPRSDSKKESSSYALSTLQGPSTSSLLPPSKTSLSTSSSPLLSTALETKSELSVSDMNRHELYALLSAIAERLKTLEPHSPTPNLLKEIATWEDKSLSDIITSVPKEELNVYLKFLGIK